MTETLSAYSSRDFNIYTTPHILSSHLEILCFGSAASFFSIFSGESLAESVSVLTKLVSAKTRALLPTFFVRLLARGFPCKPLPCFSASFAGRSSSSSSAASAVFFNWTGDYMSDFADHT